MMYPKILLEISKTQWFMEQRAFSAMLDIVNRVDLNIEAYSNFHTADEELKINALADLGEFEEDNDYTIVKDKLGILFIDGPIVPRSSSFRKFSGLTSISALTKEFKRLESDSGIETILLFMDTPGGDVTGIHEFSELVAGSKKKTIAYVFGAAASAGYYIASAADKIYSAVNGVVGSIGVVTTIFKQSDRYVEITSSQSPNKRIDPETKDGVKEIRKVLDEMADNFINTVAKNRNVSREKVLKDFGKGNILVSKSALETSMIDGVLSYDSLIDSINSVDKSVSIETKSKVDKKSDTSIIQEQQGASQALRETSKGVLTMGALLDKILVESPDLANEIKEIKENSFADGVIAAKEEIKKCAKYLGSEYPKTIKNIAISYIKGERDLAAVEGAAAYFDMTAEIENEQAAIDETVDQPETPPQEQSQISDDGVIRSPEDYQAAVKEMKTIRGIESEVN